MKNIKSDVEQNIEQVADTTKREFMKKFGSYAASVPLSGFVLMTAGSSVAHAKSHGNGCVPGNRPGHGNGYSHN